MNDAPGRVLLGHPWAEAVLPNCRNELLLRREVTSGRLLLQLLTFPSVGAAPAAHVCLPGTSEAVSRWRDIDSLLEQRLWVVLPPERRALLMCGDLDTHLHFLSQVWSLCGVSSQSAGGTTSTMRRVDLSAHGDTGRDPTLNRQPKATDRPMWIGVRPLNRRPMTGAANVSLLTTTTPGVQTLSPVAAQPRKLPPLNKAPAVAERPPHTNGATLAKKLDTPVSNHVRASRAGTRPPPPSAVLTTIKSEEIAGRLTLRQAQDHALRRGLDPNVVAANRDRARTLLRCWLYFKLNRCEVPCTNGYVCRCSPVSDMLSTRILKCPFLSVKKTRAYLRWACSPGCRRHMLELAPIPGAT